MMSEEKILLNKVGIPIQEDDSVRFRKEQNRWKAEVKKRKKTKKVEKLAYWQQISTTTSL